MCKFTRICVKKHFPIKFPFSIFHLGINCRSSLIIYVLSFLYLTIANGDVSSANSFALDFNSPRESLMQTRKRSGPKIEPQGTPSKTGLQDNVFSFKRSTCQIVLKKIIKFSRDAHTLKLIKLAFMPNLVKCF